MSSPSVARITARSSILAVFLTLVVAPLVASPYMHDDLSNRNWAQLSFSDTWSTAWQLNQEWMARDGRFFPGGWFYGLPVWHLFDTRVSYMAWMLILNLALIATVAWLVHALTKSPGIAAAAVLVLGACLQVRINALDAIQAFHGLLQVTILLTIWSGVGAAYILRTGRRWVAVPVFLGWAWAITSYEVSLFMLPGVILVLWAVCGFSDRKRAAWALAPLVIPAVIQIVVSLWLRVGATGGTPSYTTDLHGPVGVTFLKQFSAAIPSSQYLLGLTSFRTFVGPTLLLLLVVALAIPTFLLWRPAVRGGSPVTGRVSAGLIGSGVWAWMVPAALAGISVRWQTDLQWGQGYVYSLYQYVGVCLVAAGALTLVLGRSDRPRWRVAGVVFFAIACLACAITVASNISFVGQFITGPQGPG